MNRRSPAQGAMAKKTIAVASGKGGVGKSTTSVNLALMAAREGLSVALVDVDPLSDIAVVLDIDLTCMATIRDDLDGTDLGEYTLPVFPRIDLLFPRAKLRRGDPSLLHRRIFEDFAEEMDRRYDLLIFDMPAGIGAEENLAFVPAFTDIVLVCNPEPTSHVSGGGYIKAVREINPKVRFHLWHNKFGMRFEPSFNSRDLVGNYNRMVPEDLRLDAKDVAAVTDVAFIPHDFSLDLLRADSPFHYTLFGRIEDGLRAVNELMVAPLSASLAGEKLAALARHYAINAYPRLRLDDFLTFCATVGGVDSLRLDPSQESLMARYFTVQQAHPLRPWVVKILEEIREIKTLIGDEAMFAKKGSEAQRRLEQRQKLLFSGLARFFDRLALAADSSRPPWPREHTGSMVNMAGLLLSWVALLQVSATPVVRHQVAGFVPKRQTSSGITVRDRHAQIRLLVEKDDEYHKRYFTLVKGTFPLFKGLMERYARRQGWAVFVFLDNRSQLRSNVYLKLFSLALHDMLNAGLGLTVGIKYNRCAKALQEGVQEMLRRKGTRAPGRWTRGRAAEAAARTLQ